MVIRITCGPYLRDYSKGRLKSNEVLVIGEEQIMHTLFALAE